MQILVVGDHIPLMHTMTQILIPSLGVGQHTHPMYTQIHTLVQFLIAGRNTNTTPATLIYPC